MTELEKQYIEKLKEYQKLLIEELDGSVSIAWVHGWRSTNIEAGERLRNEIASLEQQIEAEEDKIFSRELTIEEIEEIKNSKYNWDEIFYEAKLKNELHEFRKYMNTRGYPFVCMDSDIDEYLKNRNNG